MTYSEAIKFLYNSTPAFERVGASAYKEGLNNTIALDRHFGSPHRDYKTIHVAGTNGKGSCSHTIASILQKSGYRVGLYTSPHLIDFRERIKVNGVCISEKYVVDFVNNEREFFAPLHPSFFEITTAMAFDYFSHEKVDVAVVEVGLGGRLDCTNIITPILSIITNISFDHTQFLGNTLSDIAREKAGIIKCGVPVVIGEITDETKLVFTQKAASTCSKLIIAEESREVTSSTPILPIGRVYETLHYGTIHGDLSGDYQERNMNTVLNAVGQLKECCGLHITYEAVREGVANVALSTGLMGRWQVLGHRPLIVCDTGHNVAGWSYLSKQIVRQQYRTLRIVFGMVDDKDLSTVMSMLPKEAIYYWTAPSTKRAIPSGKVQEIGHSHALHGDSFADVPTAYESAMCSSSPDDMIFIGGSSYVVADLLSYLRS